MQLTDDYVIAKKNIKKENFFKLNKFACTKNIYIYNRIILQEE